MEEKVKKEMAMKKRVSKPGDNFFVRRKEELEREINAKKQLVKDLESGRPILSSLGQSSPMRSKTNMASIKFDKFEKE